MSAQPDDMPASDPLPEPAQAPTRDQQLRAAAQIARRGAFRLAKLVKPDGRFIYQYHRERNLVSPQYNVLRHCGAVWSLFDVLRLTGPQDRIAEAAVRSARHMRDHFIRPFGDGDRLCVIDKDKIKLGGNGLALLALVEWNRFAPDPALADTARRLGLYIVDQRTEAGDDLHHGRHYPGGELYPFRSNYYTGEALFGLLRLFQMTGEAMWRDVAFDLLAPLGRRDYGVEERSHWMLYALDAADAIRPSPDLRAYASRIAARMLRNPESYRGRGATPIACMSEAFMAYIRLKRRNPDDPNEPTAERCEAEVVVNFAHQLKSFRPNGEVMASPDKHDVRIDYIQHNISAFAAFSALAGAPASNGPETAAAAS